MCNFPATLDLAFRAPFANYWRIMVDETNSGFVFSKMPRYQRLHYSSSAIQLACANASP